MILAGHGVENGTGVSLGSYDSSISKDRNKENKNVIWGSDSESSSFKKINQEYLDKDAEIILLSCGTGKKEGVAETVAVSLQRKTTAPVIFVQLHNLKLKVSYDENNKIHFKTIFQNEEALSAVYDHQISNQENNEKLTNNLNFQYLQHYNGITSTRYYMKNI